MASAVSMVRVRRRPRWTGARPARVAKLLGPIPLLGLLAVPLGALALALARRAGHAQPRDDARHALLTSGGVHAVVGVFAFLVAAMG